MRTLLTLFAFFASAIVLRAQAPATPQADLIVGDWRWFNNTVVKLTEDGHCIAPSVTGTWEFTNNKELERKYLLKWDQNLVVDYLTLSRDGKRLTGKNATGARVTGEKIDHGAPAGPATPAPILVPTFTAKPQSLRGNFYLSVDDAATIYVNGNKFYTAPINESRSPEMELKATDRVLMHLLNVASGHRFMMVFASSDLANIVSFRAHDFKIVPDTSATDFTVEQLPRWNKQAKQERRQNILPMKSYSEWLWGEGEDTVVACIITPQMFSQKPK